MGGVRRGICAASALLALSALTACADDDADAAATSGSGSASAGVATEATPTPTADATTRTVTHDKGETVVPIEPERIVVLDSPQLDTLLSLGITPVGAVRAGEEEDGLPSYLTDRAAGIDLVGTIENPNLEAIAALDPDLILSATVRHDELYDEFSEIAPTVFSADSGTNWREGFTLVAEAVGRADQAAAALADFDAQAERIGEGLGAADMAVSIVRFLPDETRIYGPDTFSGSVLTDVGFELPDLDYDEYSMVYISPEQIEQADSEAIFATTYGDPETTTRGAVTGLWGNLAAVENGCQFDVLDDEWMIGIGLIGARIILADLEETLGSGDCT